MDISDQIYTFFSYYIEKHLGIHYGKNDFYRLENRLKTLTSDLNFLSVDDLFRAFEKGPTREQHEALIKVATNNETYFFRDQKPFQALSSELIPALKTNAPQAPLLVWSAACSSGQEAYSICMQTKEKVPDMFPWISVEASDISYSVLAKARSGLYSAAELKRGVDGPLLEKYFKTHINPDHWQISSELKNKVKFFEFNLLDGVYPVARYDIIFCRNVLIYHPIKNRQKILDNMVMALKPGGYLLMGSGESLIGVDVDLEQKILGGAMFFQKRLKFSKTG